MPVFTLIFTDECINRDRRKRQSVKHIHRKTHIGEIDIDIKDI